MASLPWRASLPWQPPSLEPVPTTRRTQNFVATFVGNFQTSVEPPLLRKPSRNPNSPDLSWALLSCRRPAPGVVKLQGKSASFINTPLQRGDQRPATEFKPFLTVSTSPRRIHSPRPASRRRCVGNSDRISAPQAQKPLETVSASPGRSYTPLKRGVNESRTVGRQRDRRPDPTCPPSGHTSFCRDLCRIGHFSTKVSTKVSTKIRNRRTGSIAGSPPSCSGGEISRIETGSLGGHCARRP